MNAMKVFVFWLVILVSAFILWQVAKTGNSGQADPEISYTEFLARVANGKVSTVTIAGSVVRGAGSNGKFRVIAPPDKSTMLEALQQHGVEIRFKETSDRLLNLTPLVLLGALWFFMIRQMQKRRLGGNDTTGAPPSEGPTARFGT